MLGSLLMILPLLFLMALFVSMALFFIECEKQMNISYRSLRKSREWMMLTRSNYDGKMCGTCVYWNRDTSQPSGILLVDNYRCLNNKSNFYMKLTGYTENLECHVYEQIIKM